MSLRSQARVGHRLHHIAQREALYRDFIVAASAAFGRALFSNEPEINELVVLYGMTSRMRVVSSPNVVACAEKAVESIIDAYFLPNMTMPEIRASVKSGRPIDPLREFSELAREELMEF